MQYPEQQDFKTLGEIWRRRCETFNPNPKFLITGQGIKDITGCYASERKTKMNNSLILHCGSERVARSDLAKIETPMPTSSWKPIPHIQIAELVTHEAQKKGYAITSEEYGLNPAGTKMFGTLRFHPEGHPEFSRALGFRNSHDKSLSVGLCVGLSITVCDNLMFAGSDITLSRKHTSGIEIESLITDAFNNLEHRYIRLERDVEGLKMQSITVTGAKLATVKAAEMGAINSSDIIPVLSEFRNPQHEEFSERNRWSLYNACTEIAKKYTPARADKCYRKLGEIFELS